MSVKMEPFCFLTRKPPHEIIRRSSDIERITNKMQELYNGADGAVSTVYLSGNPGCGKSQLARQIGHEFFSRLADNTADLIFAATLNAESIETLADSYISLGRCLGITEYTATTLESSKSEKPGETIQQLLRLILPKVKKFSKWMMIADNVIDLRLVRGFLPPTGSEEWGHGQVLITTQDSDTIPDNAPHTYHESFSKGMKPDDAVELLEKVSKISDREQAENVARLLDYQPLALAAAAYYVKTVVNYGLPKYTWREYLETLQQIQPDVTGNILASENLAYPKTTMTAIKMAIQRAVETDEVLRQTFSFYALCANEVVPLEAVAKFVKARITEQPEKLIMAKIVRSSLICHQVEEGVEGISVCLLNSVHTVVRQGGVFNLEPRENDENLAEALKIFKSLLESTGKNYQVLNKLKRHCKCLLEHMTSHFTSPERISFEHLTPFIDLNEVIGWLVSLADICCELSDFQFAKYVVDLACSLPKNTEDTDSSATEETTARIFSISGKVYHSIGEYNQANELYEKALLITRKILGEEHRDVASSYVNVASVCESIGEYDRAKQLYEKALSIRRKILGEEHPDVASSYVNLASVYESIGEYNQAKELHEKALAIQKKNQAVPSEITLRGPMALKAYNKALAEGKACVKRVPVMLIGQDRTGKTSLKNSLMGKPFNEDEDSTVGIDVGPSHFKVSSEIWKVGESTENGQATSDAEAISFEHHAARLAAEYWKEEKRDTNSLRSENSEFKKESFLNVPSSSSNNAAELPVEIRKSAPSSEISRNTTESIHTSKDPNVDVQTPIPETFPDPIQKRKEHSLLAAEIPDEVAILIEKYLQGDEKVQDEKDIYSVLWDFGGQSVYYATHPLFFTTKAMYLLVYDLSRNPEAIAESVVKQGKLSRILENHGAKSNLDYLYFWMTSVASLGSQDKDQHVLLDRVRVNIPVVFLVCTHADDPYGGGNPRHLASEVFGYLQNKPYRNQLYKSVFFVDNRKSGTESECSEIIRLREKILAVSNELPQMKEAIPIKWLKFEKALEVRVKEGRKWISLEMAKEIATDECEIKEEQVFLTLLNLLHDQRILIHFDDPPVLNNMVVLDPQWLVDLFRKVITVPPCSQDPDELEFEELWRKLDSRGILDEKLLEHVWGPLLDKQETSASLLKILEKFSLLCPWPSPETSQYLVPSMLDSQPPENIIKLVDSAQIPSLFFKFESGYVPPGLFPRLVLQFFQWGQKEFWSSETDPQLYHSFARFYLSEDEDCSVILLCHSSSIEVVVHRENCRDDWTERFQSMLNISADVNCSAPEAACARAVCRQLRLMLESMREEFCWLRNMKYEVCIMCPVCCPRRQLSHCDTHHKQSCKQEECLHFLSESVLRSTEQFVRCRKCATATNSKVHVKQFAPWISETSDEQLTNDECDGRLISAEGGNDETLPSLPSKALESLLSQPEKPKEEFVLQLKHCMQLNQASLEQPDPRTKCLIRKLARKAKESKRLDVVKILREITPAGTTGPLCSELLKIREIPLGQVKDLTFELSGGQKWQVVAEELGLTPREIRFLDNRTRNPFAVVLAFISGQGNLRVGALYDKLIKCGLPVTADIL